MSCEHENFSAGVHVIRMTDDNDPTVVRGYTADVQIRCNSCGAHFEFQGPPMGWSESFPTVNVDRTELRVPIKPPTRTVAS